MDHRKPLMNYRIVERPWTPRLEAGLLALETPSLVAWHKDQVASGCEHPISLMSGNRTLATGLYRIDIGAVGPEFVVIGVVGAAGDMARVFALLEHMAMLKCCATLRFHTTRPGLVRRAAASGYDAAEFVMTKRVA